MRMKRSQLANIKESLSNLQAGDMPLGLRMGASQETVKNWMKFATTLTERGINAIQLTDKQLIALMNELKIKL